ncbi:MAG: hypothetical protein ACFFG0_43465, partial [Candidatus Thorarchaeota archaeon]
TENGDIKEKKEDKESSHEISSLSTNKRKNLIYYLKKLIKYTHLNLNKDLEISKSQFLTLFLVFLSSISLISVDIYHTFVTGGIKWTNIIVILLIGIGFILGLICGGIMLDKMKGKKYSSMFIILFLSILLNFFQIFVFQSYPMILNLLFLGSAFMSGFLFMFFVIFFLDFTTILERGRVFSFLIITLSIGILLILLLIVLNELFLIIPSFIIGASIFYLYENKEKEEPYRLKQKEGNPRNITISIIKYNIMYAIIGLTIGLIFPYEQISSLSIADFSDIKLIIVGFLAISFALITALIIGLVFDFMGRKASLTNIILIVAFSNFIRIFNITLRYFDIAIVLIAVLAIIMAIPLIMNEISLKKNLGQVLGLTYAITLIFIAIGYVIHWLILQNPGLVNDQDYYIAELYIVGIISFSLIIILFFLSNTKELISYKEQNWPENLLRLYVIHESGLLLYEHAFSNVEKNLTDSDLVSGGFIGLISMLEEITKTKQHLQIIDHGGKKILFGYSYNKSLIYALVISEDLRVIRHKLDYFINDIDEQYPVGKELTGVDVGLWKKRLDPIFEKHFKRKYLDLIPDYFLINLK